MCVGEIKSLKYLQEGTDFPLKSRTYTIFAKLRIVGTHDRNAL